MGGGASRQVITEALTDITTIALMNSLTSCQTNIAIDQYIRLECDGTTGDLAGSSVLAENSPQCVQCYQNALDTLLKQQQMIRLDWSPGSASIPISRDQQMLNAYNAMYSQCRGRCKACVFDNFSQANNFTWTTECETETTVYNEFTNNLKAQIEQSLNDNQGALESFMGILAPQDKQRTVVMITNRVLSRITTEFITNLYNDLNVQQNIVFRASEGGAILAQGITQQTAFSGVASLISKQNVFNTILNEQQWEVQQALYNSNNTVGELGNIVNKTIQGVGDTVTDLLGQIMLALAIVGIVVAGAVFILGIINIVRENKGTVDS